MRCRHRPAGRDRGRYARHAYQAVRRLWDGTGGPSASGRSRPWRSPANHAHAASSGQACRSRIGRIESNHSRGNRGGRRLPDRRGRAAFGSPWSCPSTGTGGGDRELLGRRGDVEPVSWLDYAVGGAGGALPNRGRELRFGPVLSRPSRTGCAGAGQSQVHGGR